VAAHGPWSTYLELRALDSSPPTWLRDWDGDGILTRTFSAETSRLVAATGLPAVELRSTHFAGGRPFVGCDNEDIGRMVAEHFYERGFRYFAAYSQRNEQFFVERVANFKKVVRAYGHRCLELPEDHPERVPDWEQSQARLIQWIAQLPKPVGIFASTDQLGVRLLEACQTAGVAVPEEVAVVGAENEETLCSFTTPPLSSVRFDGHAVGFAAAELLDRLMRGKPSRAKPTLVAPKGIEVRGSSGERVIGDRLVARAVALIREGATRGLDVNELAAKLGASRSTLDPTDEGGAATLAEGRDPARAFRRGRTAPARDEPDHRPHRRADRIHAQPLPAGGVQGPDEADAGQVPPGPGLISGAGRPRPRARPRRRPWPWSPPAGGGWPRRCGGRRPAGS
jgi:LacI family transcriptional regulator